MVLSEKRCDQSLLVDHRTAGDVDDIAVLAKALEDIGVDGVLRVSTPARTAIISTLQPVGERLQRRENIDTANRTCCG